MREGYIEAMVPEEMMTRNWNGRETFEVTTSDSSRQYSILFVFVSIFGIVYQQRRGEFMFLSKTMMTVITVRQRCIIEFCAGKIRNV